MANRRHRPSGGIERPRLPDAAPTAALPDGTLTDRALVTGLVLARGDLTGQVAQYVTFEEAQLAHMALGGTRLPSLQCRDVRFDTCDLAQASWERAQLARVELFDCRMLGFKATEARVQDTLLRGCNAQYAVFWGTKFMAVRFERCVLSEASFQDADLSGVVFAHCDLRRADLQGTKLVGADFRGSQVEGMQVGAADLRGAIIDMTQATAFAQVLGLIVLPE